MPPEHLLSLRMASEEPGVRERVAECLGHLSGAARRQIAEALEVQKAVEIAVEVHASITMVVRVG